MTDDLYRLENVSYAYATAPAVRDISLTVRAREVVGLIGPNGAGKTTVLKLLGGLLRGWHGDLSFHGAPLARWKRREIAKRVAYVPQHTNIAFPYTAREVVGMGRLPHQNGHYFETSRDRARIDWALERTDCRQLADRSFASLSGGERQLVVLASALAQEPEVLLLDEPTVFLDLRHQLVLAATLRELHREQGLTLVVVTHDLNLAQSFCDRIIAMKEGRVAAIRERTSASPVALGADLLERVFDVAAVSEYRGDRHCIVLSWER